jgi:hypothetical protein
MLFAQLTHAIGLNDICDALRLELAKKFGADSIDLLPADDVSGRED